MEKSEFVKEIPDKKQFLIDMINLSEHENFEIGEALEEQSEILNELSEIAKQIGHIKQSARCEIYELARTKSIKMEINKRPREFKLLNFGED